MINGLKRHMTLEAAFTLAWFIIYLLDTTNDTPLIIAMMMMATHNVITEIRKITKENNGN